MTDLLDYKWDVGWYLTVKQKKNGNLCLCYGLLKKKKKETDEDLILVKDGGKYRIAWDVRIEVH